MSPTPARWFVASAFACGLALASPALLVDFPITTDLPQHLTQVRAFLEALREPGGPYVIQWATPYLFGYLLPLLSWLVAGPLWAGKLTLAACAGLWSGSAHVLAHRLQRGVAPAVVACVPFFGASLQWGFLSFLVGFAVFTAHFLVTQRALEAPTWRGRALVLVLSLLLYATHLLWFGAGVAVLVLQGARLRAWRPLGGALALHLPAAALAAWSTLNIHQHFTNTTVWGPLLYRVQPGWWGLNVLGAARDGAPALLFVALVAWLLAGAWQHRGERAAFSWALVTTAALFTAFVLFFPSRYTNTVQFETRWASPALVLWALGVPAPRLRLTGALAALLLALTTADLTLAWWHVNDEELTGLEASLDAVPAQARVLGLTFMKTSAHVEGAPFLQLFAWAQVMHGGAVNFSFADFSVMPVVFKQPGHPWTNGLEWYPERVQPGDFRFFDVALVAGDDAVQAQAAGHPLLRALTTTGHWRLYAITPQPLP